MNLYKLARKLFIIFVLSASMVNGHDFFNFKIFHETSKHHSHSISQDEAIALYSEKQKHLSFDACIDEFPERKPLSLNIVSIAMKPIALCSDNFAVLYSEVSKTPLVVVERLTATQLKNAKNEKRTNKFYPDPRIPQNYRAELNDYHDQNPVVDRGHQAPAGDAPTQNAMAQSFSLSNIVPQDPVNNRKMWNKIESDVRKFVKRTNGNVYVFTGPIFNAGHVTVGNNKVWKPIRLYKLIYDETSQRAWAYILPNTSEANVGKPMDYSTFVQITRLNLLDNIHIIGSVR